MSGDIRVRVVGWGSCREVGYCNCVTNRKNDEIRRRSCRNNGSMVALDWGLQDERRYLHITAILTPNYLSP